MVFEGVILSSNLQCPPITGRFFCVKDYHVPIFVYLFFYYNFVCYIVYDLTPDHLQVQPRPEGRSIKRSLE